MYEYFMRFHEINQISAGFLQILTLFPKILSHGRNKNTKISDSSSLLHVSGYKIHFFT
jgi:hypothetical protein